MRRNANVSASELQFISEHTAVYMFCLIFNKKIGNGISSDIQISRKMNSSISV
jgi:hypothetical protein